MKLATSLFDKGIFKNTLKRFCWGSILYFVILFFAIPFTLLVSDIHYLSQMESSYYKTPLLLNGLYIGFPILMAIIVPTIVAVLVQNNVHSAKQGIFMHGLPVTRKATYISQLLASGVLMAAPVAANALILLIMSFTPYGRIISSSSVIYWFLLNFSVQFVMFSVAVFSGYLTGNAAAHIGINAFLHIALLLLGLIIYLVSDVFLFGFAQSDNFIANQLVNYNPVVWLTMHIDQDNIGVFKTVCFWVYILVAVFFYVISYVLYKNRRIEACGDVAAFKVFRPILKYAVVTAAVSVIFGIFENPGAPAFAIFFIAAITGGVCYFAAEMLLSKSFKVFGKYKGYLGFMAVAAAFISFFAFTSVFGYETRIPDKEDIASASIYEGYSQEVPMLSDSDFIDDCIAYHKEFIKDIPITVKDYNRILYVSYQLKNGSTMNRQYYLDNEMADAALSKMYEYGEYKIINADFHKLNVDNVKYLTLDLGANGVSHTYTFTDENATQFLYAVEKDIREISYEDMNKLQNYLSVYIDASKEENDRLHYFDDSVYGENAMPNYTYGIGVGINGNYKNTLEFLRENGYYDDIINEIASNLSILKIPVTKETEESDFTEEIYRYKNDTGRYEEFYVNTDDLVYLQAQDAKALAELILITPDCTGKQGSAYYIYSFPKDERTVLTFGDRITAFDSENLPEVLKKYVG